MQASKDCNVLSRRTIRRPTGRPHNASAPKPGRVHESRQGDQIVKIHTKSYAIVASGGSRWAGRFFDIGAEKTVKQAQYTTVVAVEVQGLLPYARGVDGIEHVLDPTWQLGNGVGMNKELIGKVDGQHQKHHGWMYAQQHRRHVENPNANKGVDNALPRRHGHIHVLARVMRHMRRPKPADAVTGAMKPVVAELDEQKDRNSSPGINGNIE